MLLFQDNNFLKVFSFCKDSSLDERPRGTRRWRGLTHLKVTRRSWYAAKFSKTEPRGTRSRRGWHLYFRHIFDSILLALRCLAVSDWTDEKSVLWYCQLRSTWNCFFQADKELTFDRKTSCDIHYIWQCLFCLMRWKRAGDILPLVEHSYLYLVFMWKVQHAEIMI